MRELIFGEADANLVFGDRDGETFVMNPGGDVFPFNALQIEILRMLDGKTELGEIARRCAEEFGQPIEIEELRQFLRDAREIGLLSLRTAGTQAHLEKDARALHRKVLAAHWPPPGLQAPLDEFAARVLERLSAGDARGAAAAAAALKAVAPPGEAWVTYAETAIETLLRPRARISFTLGRVAIPLFNPTKLLKVLDGWLGWTFGWKGIAFYGALIYFGVRLSPPVGLLKIHDYFHGSVAVVFYLCDALGLLTHELGHALCCYHYGGQVPFIGTGWLYVGPMAYSDVTSSYLFEKKRHRVLVMLSGTVGTLLFMAALTILWHFIPKGNPVDLGIRASLFFSWLNVFYNFIPFFQTDGYFALAELLDTPNLWDRSSALVRNVVGRLLVGELIPRSEEPPGVRSKLLIYGLVNTSYMAFVWFVMIPFAYQRTPAEVRPAFIAATSFGAMWVIYGISMAIRRMVSFAAGHPREVLRTKLAWRWALPLGLLLILCLAPWLPETADATFGLEPADHLELRTEVAGEVETIPIHWGEAVQPGQVVAILHNPELELQRQLAQADLELARIDLTRLEHGARAAEKRLASTVVALSAAELRKADVLAQRESERKSSGLATADSLATEQADQAEATEASRVATSSLELVNAGSRSEDLDGARARVAEAQDRLMATQEQLAKLELRSPIAGVIEDLDLASKIGKWLKPGETFAVVVDGSHFVAKVLPSWLSDPQHIVGGVVKLFLPDGRQIRGAVTRVLPQSSEWDANHGVTLETAPIHGSGLDWGLMGTAVVYGPREPLVVQLFWHPLQRFWEFMLWIMF